MEHGSNGLWHFDDPPTPDELATKATEVNPLLQEVPAPGVAQHPGGRRGTQRTVSRALPGVPGRPGVGAPALGHALNGGTGAPPALTGR